LDFPRRRGHGRQLRDRSSRKGGRSVKTQDHIHFLMGAAAYGVSGKVVQG